MAMTQNGFTFNSTTSNWFFGTYNATAGNCVPGTLSDFRVYAGTVLTPQQITRNYQAGPRTKL
jgi:hypothetical protein